jgi:hypothetical protein
MYSMRAARNALRELHADAMSRGRVDPILRIEGLDHVVRENRSSYAERDTPHAPAYPQTANSTEVRGVMMVSALVETHSPSDVASGREMYASAFAGVVLI